MIIAMVCDFLGEENNGTTIFCYNLIEWLKTSIINADKRPSALHKRLKKCIIN